RLAADLFARLPQIARRNGNARAVTFELSRRSYPGLRSASVPDLGPHSDERSANRSRLPHRPARRSQNSNKLGRLTDGKSKFIQTRTSLRAERVASARTTTTKRVIPAKPA